MFVEKIIYISIKKLTSVLREKVISGFLKGNEYIGELNIISIKGDQNSLYQTLIFKHQRSKQ